MRSITERHSLLTPSSTRCFPHGAYVGFTMFRTTANSTRFRANLSSAGARPLYPPRVHRRIRPRTVWFRRATLFRLFILTDVTVIRLICSWRVIYARASGCKGIRLALCPPLSTYPLPDTHRRVALSQMEGIDQRIPLVS